MDTLIWRMIFAFNIEILPFHKNFTSVMSVWGIQEPVWLCLTKSKPLLRTALVWSRLGTLMIQMRFHGRLGAFGHFVISKPMRQLPMVFEGCLPEPLLNRYASGFFYWWSDVCFFTSKSRICARGKGETVVLIYAWAFWEETETDFGYFGALLITCFGEYKNRKGFGYFGD